MRLDLRAFLKHAQDVLPFDHSELAQLAADEVIGNRGGEAEGVLQVENFPFEVTSQAVIFLTLILALNASIVTTLSMTRSRTHSNATLHEDVEVFRRLLLHNVLAVAVSIQAVPVSITTRGRQHPALRTARTLSDCARSASAEAISVHRATVIRLLCTTR